MKKKPRTTDETQPAVKAELTAPVCWDRDVNAQGLRVEMNDGATFVFPYAHLSYAKLKNEAGGDALSLMFGSHEVCVTGKRLRDLLLAVQKLTAEWVRELPARYAPLADGDSAFIEKIVVKALSEDNSAGD